MNGVCSYEMQQRTLRRAQIRTWCCIEHWSLFFARKAVQIFIHMYSAGRILHVQYSSIALLRQRRANPATVVRHVTKADLMLNTKKCELIAEAWVRHKIDWILPCSSQFVSGYPARFYYLDHLLDVIRTDSAFVHRLRDSSSLPSV